MNDTAIRRAVLRRMEDGRERTISDILHHVKVDPDILTGVLRSMVLRKELRSAMLSDGKTNYAVYRIGRGRETAATRGENLR